MDIAIIELAEPGHFTLVDSTTRIFSCDPGNRVRLFLREKNHTSGELLKNQVKRPNVSVHHLNELPHFTNTLSIIITPDQSLEQVERISRDVSWIFIHNIDDWFLTGTTRVIRQVWSALLDGFNWRLAWYYLKRNMAETKKRKAIIRNILKHPESRFVVLNNTLKKHLGKLVDEAKIEVLPFSVYDKELVIENPRNTTLRVCIPGMVSQSRRDYTGFLHSLSSADAVVKKGLTVDLLGGFSNSAAEKGQEVKKLALELQSKGFNIIVREKAYIHLDEFDEELNKADIILGNLNIDLGAGSSYGGTKESGIPFTMIRMAKPGLLPEGYQTISEIASSTLEYKGYDHLLDIIRSLIDSPELLSTYTKNARANSEMFTDVVVYHKLNMPRYIE